MRLNALEKKLLMQARGSEMSRDIGAVTSFSGDDIDADEMSEAAIRKLILNANQGILNISYKNGVNSVSISPEGFGGNQLVVMGIAMLLAIVAGFVLRMIPGNIADTINDMVLIPIRTMIVNCLQMIVGPMVFFSIASSVGQFSDFRMLGKTGARVISFYFMTTLLAVTLSIGFFYIFQPGSWGVLINADSVGEVGEVATINFIDTLVSSVPSNFVRAFADNNTMQIIILALFFGIASAMLGNNSSAVEMFFNCGTELILKITELITKVIPLMIFVSFSSLLYTMNKESLLSLLSIFGTLIITDIVMIIVYGLLILLFIGQNPLQFLKGVFPAWMNAFALQSSNAAMPVTMDICRKNLHVSSKLYSFSIPLGATINMDGATICFCLCGLFFAKCYGIEIGISELLTLAITAVIISVSTPGLPGACVMGYSIILSTLGVPAEALTLFIAIGTFIDPIDTADNVLGDTVGTYIVACKSGMIEGREGV